MSNYYKQNKKINVGDFFIWDNVRESGDINMADVRGVSDLSGLDVEKCRYILRNYKILWQTYKAKGQRGFLIDEYNDPDPVADWHLATEGYLTHEEGEYYFTDVEYQNKEKLSEKQVKKQFFEFDDVMARFRNKSKAFSAILDKYGEPH